ncbi:hypothetical protein JCM8208_003800 [Rhodotorula glutinis]
MSIYNLLATLASPELPLAACATSSPVLVTPPSSFLDTLSPSSSTSCDLRDVDGPVWATSEDVFASRPFTDDDLKLLLAYSETANDALHRLAGSANLPLDHRHAGPATIVASSLPTFDSAPRHAPPPASLAHLLTDSTAPGPTSSPAPALARASAPARAARVAPVSRSTAGLLDRLAGAPKLKAALGTATAAASGASPMPVSGPSRLGSALKRGRANNVGEDDEQPPRAIKIVKVVSPSSLGLGSSSQAQPKPMPASRARAFPPKPKKVYDASTAYDGSCLYKSPADSPTKRSRAKKVKRAVPAPTTSLLKATASTAVSHAQARPEPAPAHVTDAPASPAPTASTTSAVTLGADSHFDATALLALLDKCPVNTPTHPLATPTSPIPIQASVPHPSLGDWSTSSSLSSIRSFDDSTSHDASRSSSIGSASSFWSTMSGSSAYSAHSSEYSSPPLPLFLGEGACATAFDGYSLGTAVAAQYPPSQSCSLQLGEPLGHRLALEEQPATLGAPFDLGDISVGSAADYEYTPPSSPSPGLYPSWYEFA